MKKIAVVSKNKALARLIELEAQSVGATSRALVTFPKDRDVFSVIFIDTDSVDIAAAYLGDKVVEISSGFLCDTQGKLSYPPSLVKIREYITSCGVVEDINKRQEPEADEKIIYFDIKESSVRFMGESCPLSEYEMRLLRYLCDRAGRSVSRAELSGLLGADSGNICDVYVCRLRKKLEKNGERKVIYTVRNQGYMTRYRSEITE